MHTSRNCSPAVNWQALVSTWGSSLRASADELVGLSTLRRKNVLGRFRSPRSMQLRGTSV